MHRNDWKTIWSILVLTWNSKNRKKLNRCNSYITCPARWLDYRTIWEVDLEFFLHRGRHFQKILGWTIHVSPPSIALMPIGRRHCGFGLEHPTWSLAWWNLVRSWSGNPSSLTSLLCTVARRIPSSRRAGRSDTTILQVPPPPRRCYSSAGREPRDWAWVQHTAHTTLAPVTERGGRQVTHSPRPTQWLY